MKKEVQQRIVLFVAILNSIVVVALFIFVLYFIYSPESSFNRSVASTIRNAVGSLKLPDAIDGEDGRIGLSGADGEDGKDGMNGRDGKDGVNGQNVTPEQIAQAVASYIRANPPRDGQDGANGLNGANGEKGDAGEPGPVAEWRCNQESNLWEYRYNSEDDWMMTDGKCTPAENNHGGGIIDVTASE